MWRCAVQVAPAVADTERVRAEILATVQARMHAVILHPSPPLAATLLTGATTDNASD